MNPLQLLGESVVPMFALPSRGMRFRLAGRSPRTRAALRRAGFVTPIGWVYLTILLALIVVVVAVFAWIIASANVTIAENVAELAANNGAALGLQFLIAGTLPGTPIPIIALPEPTRTNEILSYIVDNALPGGALAKYLSPLQAGDVVVTVSPMAPVSASVTVTARAGRTGQFVSTATRSALARAANRVEPGRLVRTGNGGTPLPSGVLPLAVEMSAFEGLRAGFPDRDRRSEPNTVVSGSPEQEWPVGPGLLPLTLGKTAFAASLLSAEVDGPRNRIVVKDRAAQVGTQLLIASAEFLGYGGAGEPAGAAPPGFSVGQRLAFPPGLQQQASRVIPPTDDGMSGLGNEPGSELDEAAVSLAEVLLKHLEGRAVIVPLVEGQVIQGFAVATLRRQGAAEIALEFLPSVLSPLARIEPHIAAVSAQLSAASGLAMGLSMPGMQTEALSESVVGDTLEIAG